MTGATPDGDTTGLKRTRGGCLAVGCLVPVLIIVALGIGTFFAGRAYVRNNLDEWRDRSPIVGLAITVLGLRGEASPIGSLEPVRGDSDPALLPDELVIYPTQTSPTVSVNERTVVVFQEVDESVEAVIDGLEFALSSARWERIADDPTPGGTVLTWKSEGWGCTYEVVEGVRFASEIWTRCASSDATAGSD